jgi:hypothetical protein
MDGRMCLKPPLPKEHGSWAMFVVPLIVGLAVARVWNPRSIILIIAALGLFLLRYPLALIVKTRRRPDADRDQLWRWTVIYAALALSGSWLIVAEGLSWLIPIGLIGFALILLHLWLVARRQELSIVGELTGIFGLALGAPLAYYTARGQLDGTAAALWLVNALYFGGTVFYIKLKVRQQPRRPAPDRLSERLVKARACLAYQAFTLTIVLALVALQRAPEWLPLAFLPMTLKVIYGAWRWQDKRSLSLPRLGVIEIVHAIVFSALVIAAFA